MAKGLILGGGFGGVIAAEALARQLGDEHQITLISRNRRFVFYPALVRLAFGKCEPDQVAFDLRKSMLSRRVNFIEAEVARLDPQERKVILAHGEVEGSIPYDYLIVGLGRRLATERAPGFFEHAHHLLDVDGALKFGEALRGFREGRAVIGQCPDARLPVPVYETAFALSEWLEENGNRQSVRITVVSPQTIESEFADPTIAASVSQAPASFRNDEEAIMKVKEVMTVDPTAMWITDSLANAAKSMWQNDCGILPIIKEDRKVVGVITDRDVCMATAMRDRPQSSISVEEVMTGTVYSVMPDDDVHKALELMQEHKVRRLPVMNAKGELKGMLSMNDLVLKAEEANGKKPPQLNFHDIVKTYKAICEHPVPMVAAATAAPAE